MQQVALLAFLAAVAQAATPQGFNYGSTAPSGAAYMQSDFERMFKQAQNLPGTSGFSSARLYTMMQAGASNTIISAIPAALSTKTTLLLGMWVSTGANDDSAFKAELAMLKAAVDKYGDKLKDVVVGISVGSEDMYRDSPTGKTSDSPGPGQGGAAIASFIQQTKDYIKNTPLSGVPVGHVDTWTAWSDPNYADGIKNADFLGVDAYPFWQLTDDNTIDNGKSLFDQAMGKVQAVSQGKPLWITESGWPVKGKTQNKAEANSQNAQNFWQAVGCDAFGKTPTWWYTLEETVTGENPDFSIVDPSNGKPYFDLSCSAAKNTTSSSSASASATASGAASTGTGSSTGSGSSNGTYTSGSPSSPTTGTGSGTGTGAGAGSSGTPGTGTGTGTGTGSGTGSSVSGSASSPVATAGAATLGVFSAGSLLAIAAAVAALL